MSAGSTARLQSAGGRQIVTGESMRRVLTVVYLAMISLTGVGDSGRGVAGMPVPPRFSGQSDVGGPGRVGGTWYDPVLERYMIRGGGSNMWFTHDAFHFAWTRWEGELVLEASIEWPQSGGDPHRKACLMIRQSLESDSPYVDAVVHGDGLTSLQFREEQGGATREIQAGTRSPDRLRLERCGDTIWMSVGTAGKSLQPAGGSVQLKFTEPVYVGLGVCAHDDLALEEAWFSAVRVERPAHAEDGPRVLESTLEIMSVASTDRRVVYTAREHFEAPNWSRDGAALVFNRGGRICQIPLAGGVPVVLDTGFAVRCNNDHGLSPDGAMLAISDQTETGQSLIYVVPATGGAPRRVTPLGPSYWHSWSPDGLNLAYCAERDGEYDIYTIPVAGGAERRLTSAPGLDDGPDYSPDGRWIYFNSERSGTMQIWRMHPDGSNQHALTDDALNDWFPHPSPDGRWVVFLSYAPGVKGHPANHEVWLRLMPAEGGSIRTLARLFGGQGTLNVPSWSPDSRQFAFVSYRLVDLAH
jgi:TolB protein